MSYAEPARENAALESVTYPDDRTREFFYDEAGKVIALVEPSGASYEIERDERGAIATIIDPLGRDIALVSDDAGALQGIVFPDGSQEAFLFDADEQTAVRVHRNGSETHYKLDAQERIAQIVSGPEGATGFGYDAQGGLSFVEQNGQRISFKTEGDNTTEEHGPDGKVNYEYDGDGRLTALNNPFGDRLQYAYDQDGRLANITLWDGRSLHIESNDEDLIARFQFPGGVVVHQHYGPALRLSRREVQTADGSVQQVSYSYDDCARFTGDAEAGPQGHQRQISYDEDDHVVREVVNGHNQDYAFDVKGNMVQAGELALAVGPMDEPLRFGDQSISYDPRGNMLLLPGAQGPLVCKYRHDGMLTECQGASGLVTFKYDALGRRVEKRSQNQIWRFGWTGQQLLWEEYKAAEYATPVRRDYLFLPGTMQPLGFREQGRCYWLMTDARGAVDLALDDQGQVVWKARYDSFGRVELEVNKVRQPWRMQGQYADDETGLYYNFARYYSPHLRTYLSLDPRWIELEASHYSYCRNDPWNRADPFGGLAPLVAIGVAGLVGAVVGGVTAAVTGGDPLAGAVEGAVAGAVAGAGAAVAVVAGASAAVVLAAGVVASGVGAFVGQISEQAHKGDQFCISCALKGAAVAAATDLALLGLGKVPGVKQLVRSVGKKLVKLAKPLKTLVKKKLKDIKSVWNAARKPKKRSRRKLVQNPHKDCGKVVIYKSKDVQHTGLEKDHTPSGGALEIATMEKLQPYFENKSLKSSQAAEIVRFVKNNMPTIAIPPDVHKEGRTYKGKNTLKQRTDDAQDLNEAAKRDIKAIQESMKSKKHGCSKAYAIAAKEVLAFDFEAYIDETIVSFTKKST
ncbi:MAG: hypothetical protein JZU64_15810 [Rhodoferax sp.]|nr:hypothetical protein [Rhodoferax sp.]